MNHREADATKISAALELLNANGLGRMADAIQDLMNESMSIEQAAPDERAASPSA